MAPQGPDPWNCRRGGRPAAINAFLSANPGRKFSLGEILAGVQPTAPTLNLSHLEDYFTWYGKSILLDLVIEKEDGVPKYVTFKSGSAINAFLAANPGRKFTLDEILAGVRPTAPTLNLSHLEDYFTRHESILLDLVIEKEDGVPKHVTFKSGS